MSSDSEFAVFPSAVVEGKELFEEIAVALKTDSQMEKGTRGRKNFSAVENSCRLSSSLLIFKVNRAILRYIQ